MKAATEQYKFPVGLLILLYVEGGYLQLTSLSTWMNPKLYTFEWVVYKTIPCLLYYKFTRSDLYASDSI